MKLFFLPTFLIAKNVNLTSKKKKTEINSLEAFTLPYELS